MRWPVVFVAGFALILFCDGIACSAAELIINVAEAGSDDGEMKSLPEEGKTSTAVTYNNGFVKPSNTRIMETSSAPHPAPQPSLQTVAEIIAGAKFRVAAIPANCTLVAEYFTNDIVPCLPYLENVLASNSSSSGGGGGNNATTDSLDACCTVVKNNTTGLSRIIDALATKRLTPECLCTLGELLLYSVRNDLVAPLLQVPGMCGGDAALQEGNSVGLYKDGFYVPINIYFKPNCPKIAAQLDASAPGAAAGVPPSQNLSAGPPSPSTTPAIDDATAPSSDGVTAASPVNYLFLPFLCSVIVGNLPCCSLR